MSVPVTTVQVAISLWQITGQPLPNARVQFGLTKADVQTGSGLVLPAPIDLFVDANGTGVATLFANVDGLQGTQTSVAIYSATGQLQYSGYASIPAFNCNLHDVLNLTTPSVTDAQTAVNTARDWALRTGSDVPEGVAGDRSSKSWAQEDLTPSGQNRGGSSKDWAISSTLPDGVNSSAKTSAAAAAATALQTAADRVQTGLDRVQTDADVVAANASQQAAAGSAGTAVAQASLAQGYAASAASVAQQDLSGVTAAALHRSPNAIVAMCIDDPRTHSDGGAWTSKVDHLSWMNEALNGKWLGAQASEAAARAVSGATTGDYFQLTTDGKFYKLNAGAGTTEVFRGNVAHYGRTAWVAEASRVVGYSLDQPGRPMWMVFSGGVGKAVYGWSSNLSCLASREGELLVGSNGAGGLARINFSKDRSVLLISSTDLYNLWNIAQRNVGTVDVPNAGPTGALPSRTVNAVAMTTMPDAPVDPVTGLQVPTIAVATGGGVSVIQNDGSVVNSSSAAAATKVAIDYRDLFWLTASGALYASTPGKLGAAFAAANTYTTSAGPALLGAPTLVAA